MTDRDRFAAHAMAAIIANMKEDGINATLSRLKSADGRKIAEAAYCMADYMEKSKDRGSDGQE